MRRFAVFLTLVWSSLYCFGAASVDPWLVISNQWTSFPMEAVLRAAGTNNSDAQYFYGRMALQLKTPQGTNDAVKWVGAAATNGLPDAQNYFGLIVEKIPARSVSEAIQWYEKAAANSSYKGYFNLGLAYHKGEKVKKDPAKAAEWFKKGAEMQRPDAQNMYAIHLRDGLGVQKNPAEAFRLFQAAADAGLDLAWFNLALAHYHGTGTPVNRQKAADSYRKAAAMGYSYAKNNLGWMLYNGEGIPKNEAEGISFLKAAAESGLTKAQRELGWLFARDHESRDFEEGLMWLKKAAAVRDSHAIFLLGYFQEETDPVEAEKWLKLSAENGNGEAAYMLGEMLRWGKRGKEREQEGHDWLKKAGELGYARAKEDVAISESYSGKMGPLIELANEGSEYALRTLADYYYRGQGVPRDLTKAFEYTQKIGPSFGLGRMIARGEGTQRNYAKAWEIFDFWDSNWKWPKAANALGYMNFHGLGVPKNEQKAFGYFSKHEEDDYAMASRGAQLVLGQGVKKDLDKGVRLLVQAGHEGDINFAIAIYNGWGVPKNVDRAFALFLESAKRGDAQALFNLGLLYTAGEGTMRDTYQACMFLSLAASKDYPRANEFIEKIGSHLTSQQKILAAKRGEQWLAGTGYHPTSDEVFPEGIRLPDIAPVFPPRVAKKEVK